MLSLTVFEFTKYKYLPKNKEGLFCRWSYTEIEKIDIQEIDPLSYNYIPVNSNDNESRLYTRVYQEPQVSPHRELKHLKHLRCQIFLGLDKAQRLRFH